MLPLQLSRCNFSSTLSQLAGVFYFNRRDFCFLRFDSSIFYKSKFESLSSIDDANLMLEAYLRRKQACLKNSFVYLAAKQVYVLTSNADACTPHHAHCIWLQASAVHSRQHQTWVITLESTLACGPTFCIERRFYFTSVFCPVSRSCAHSGIALQVGSRCSSRRCATFLVFQITKSFFKFARD
jgi:hypothetical protein